MGFINAGQAAPFELISDYTIPWLGQTPLSTILAGAAGVLVVLGLAYVAGRALQKKSPEPESSVVNLKS
jgi:cobalt/nickel transport system permease protein